VFDHALTRPWTVDKRYRRLDEVIWYEDNCTEDNHHFILGKEEYFVDGDGFFAVAEGTGAARHALFQVTRSRHCCMEEQARRSSPLPTR
jgi:hypothetical protein